MKISLEWLKDYLDPGLPLPQLINRLTMIGLVVEAYEEKNGDVVLDVETYANRPDTLGHLGMAREMAAMLGLPLKEPTAALAELQEKISDLVDVQIWDEDLCPRYCGLVVKDIQAGPSPDWLLKRIGAMGLNPVNNVVDVSNHVLFATAHPIHAFDLEKLAGRKVIIRRAKKGERLLALGGSDLSLEPDMLVIADEARPVALAGIIGGQETAVTDTTRQVFIESAFFNPVSVRKTSKALGLQTDASYRFEREADISFPPQAARLAAALLASFGGKTAQGMVDIYPKPRKNPEFMLRQRRVLDLLGVEIGADFIQKVLSRLGFELRAEARESWLVKVPFFRVDIEREADLIEEIARFYGYDRIPAVLPPLKVIERFPQEESKAEHSRQVFLQQGFDEALNSSFADPECQALFQVPRRPVEIRNPISTRASQLRTTLAGGLLENVAWNLNRGQEGVYLFEIGNIYEQNEESPREHLAVGIVACGRKGEVYWQKKPEEAALFQVKGTVEALLTHLRYEPFRFQAKEHPLFDSRSSLALMHKGARIGCLGQIHPRVLAAYDLKKDVAYGELDLETLFEKKPKPFQFSALARFPGVVRDLSFLVKADVSFQEIKDELDKLSLPYWESFELVDRFSGSSIPQGQVSLTFRFLFRNPNATLQTAEVDKLQQRIIAHLHAAFRMNVREGGQGN
jgi:phenylalanyl-tRNA synthetase beta chain